MLDLKNKEAQDWSDDSGKTIIIDTNKEEQLDDNWQKWEQMPRDKKRESDWKSIELFGFDNKTRYENMKNKLNNSDINNKTLEKEYIPTSSRINEQIEDDYIDFKHISYPEDSIKQAEKWQFSSMIYIIRPMDTEDELDTLWQNFESMSFKRKQLSNDMSNELFGVDNKVHYEFLKSKFLKKDIPDTEYNGDAIENEDSTIVTTENSFIKGLYNRILYSDDMTTIAEDAIKLSTIEPKSVLDSVLKNNAIKEAKEKLRNAKEDSFTRIDGITPFYTSDELIDMGVYDNNIFSEKLYTNKLENSTDIQSWFKYYKNLCEGMKYENYDSINKSWVETITNLYREMNNTTDENTIKSIKESILQLGWNPILEFNTINCRRANNRVNTILKEKYPQEFYDITEAVNRCTNIEIITEAEFFANSDVKPVFLVFINSDNIINKVISKVTNSKWGHAAIGFDPKLTSLYSYNIKGNGFTIESIHKYTDVTKLRVFCTFAPTTAVKKMKSAIGDYKRKRDSTSYSLINLITMPLKIKYTSSMNMVCSQFVDSMLKIANMDFTNKNSSLVAPGDLQRKLIRNKTMHKIYDGPIEKYSPEKVKNFLTGLISPVSESYCPDIADKELLKLAEPYNNISIIREVNEFPIQFDADGNLVIKKMNKLDFEEEYAKSHKLLLSYEKTNNIEGIKYELSKLWFMNQVIERKIHDKETKESNIEDLYKVRARILNDFNKYLVMVNKEDNEFNFVEYYNSSPFNDTKVRINRSTLKYTREYIRKLLYL